MAATSISRCRMKPKSLCPKCGEIFSRKWNMREHCRTQHHYDPDPNPRPSPIRQRKTTGLIDSSVNAKGSTTKSAPVEKFLKMMANSLRFQQTEVWEGKSEEIAKSLGSIESALDCLLDNFVIVRKQDFHGISGYFCNKCLSFQYRYIKNIWVEMTAREQHEHLPNMPNGADRKAKEKERQSQANTLLIELTNSLFGESKKIDVYRCVGPEDFRGPLLKYKSLTSYQWAAIAIRNKAMAFSNEYINEFITTVEGTYAQIIVETGSLSGTYLISVQSIG